MDNQPSCSCSGGPKLIFACSGAADVGEISDRAARKMSREGTGKMFCMAGIGGRIEGIMKTTAAASDILAIDGCPLDCARSSLEQAGFQKFKHLQLADLDMEKGKTAPTEENIERAATKGKEMLN
jgi:uncharacterized metal-binding protein